MIKKLKFNWPLWCLVRRPNDDSSISMLPVNFMRIIISVTQSLNGCLSQSPLTCCCISCSTLLQVCTATCHPGIRWWIGKYRAGGSETFEKMTTTLRRFRGHCCISIDSHPKRSSFFWNSMTAKPLTLHRNSNEVFDYCVLQCICRVQTLTLMAWAAPSHYLNQFWNSVNWTLGDIFQRNYNQNKKVFIKQNAFENVVWKMAVVLSWPQCGSSHMIK